MGLTRPAHPCSNLLHKQRSSLPTGQLAAVVTGSVHESGKTAAA
jgi:hypothetical protein